MQMAYLPGLTFDGSVHGIRARAIVHNFRSVEVARMRVMNHPGVYSVFNALLAQIRNGTPVVTVRSSTGEVFEELSASITERCTEMLNGPWLTDVLYSLVLSGSVCIRQDTPHQLDLVALIPTDIQGGIVTYDIPGYGQCTLFLPIGSSVSKVPYFTRREDFERWIDERSRYIRVYTFTTVEPLTGQPRSPAVVALPIVEEDYNRKVSLAIHESNAAMPYAIFRVNADELNATGLISRQNDGGTRVAYTTMIEAMRTSAELQNGAMGKMLRMAMGASVDGTQNATTRQTSAGEVRDVGIEGVRLLPVPPGFDVDFKSIGAPPQDSASKDRHTRTQIEFVFGIPSGDGGVPGKQTTGSALHSSFGPEATRRSETVSAYQRFLSSLLEDEIRRSLAWHCRAMKNRNPGVEDDQYPMIEAADMAGMDVSVRINGNVNSLQLIQVVMSGIVDPRVANSVLTQQFKLPTLDEIAHDEQTRASVLPVEHDTEPEYSVAGHAYASQPEAVRQAKQPDMMSVEPKVITGSGVRQKPSKRHTQQAGSSSKKQHAAPGIVDQTAQ